MSSNFVYILNVYRSFIQIYLYRYIYYSQFFTRIFIRFKIWWQVGKWGSLISKLQYACAFSYFWCKYSLLNHVHIVVLKITLAVTNLASNRYNLPSGSRVDLHLTARNSEFNEYILGMSVSLPQSKREFGYSIHQL